MKGHIRERSPGRWAIILDAVEPGSGKRKRRWHSFQGTKREAQRECARLVTEHVNGTLPEPSKTTLAQYLDRWLIHIKTQVTPKSHERYSGIVEQNLKPLLGGVVLNKLRPIQISDAYATALKSGRRDGKDGGLSPRSVHHMHRILKQALKQAVKWELLKRNPADAVDPPKVEQAPMQTYDLAQTVEILEIMRGLPISIPAVLALLCGLRRGEICALRWRNVDLSRNAVGSMAIAESMEQTKAGLRYKQPKSGKARSVALSATVMDVLRAHRAQRAQDLLKLGVRLSDDDHVVGHPDGSIFTPIYVSQQWARAIRRTGLPRLRFHDLRHAHATHLLGSGVHPKIASERLGHSRVGITLDLYSHVIQGMQEDAAATVDLALQQAIQKRNGSNPVANGEVVEMPLRKTVDGSEA